MDQPSPSAHLTSLHGGHVALVLGLIFLVLYALQPLIDPTPENEPTQRELKSDDESPQNNQQEEGRRIVPQESE